MNALKKTLGLATIAAMLMTSTAPAMARPGHGWGGGYGGYGGHGGYYGGGYGRGWGGHRHHDGDGFGNFLLGAVVAGGIIALATSASKNRSTSGRSVDEGRRSGEHGTNRSAWTDAENDAASACAQGVEDEAENRGIKDRVDDIDYVDRDGSDGYRVEGRLEGGKAFACGVRQNGDLAWVQLADNSVAWR